MRKKNFQKNQGFTLIELLVVIAIIGILSSIMISSLSEARKKAKDLVIKNAILEGLKEAEMYYDETGSYDGICGEPDFVAGGAIEKSISNNGGAFVCGDGSDGFCFSSTLNKGGSLCADVYRETKSGFVCADANDIVCD